MPTVTTYPGVFGPYSPITFTRASTATYFDSTGTLQSAAIDAPRLDYNPSTLAAQGLLIEEARTNSIRNNTMVGAVAGTPGTLPTNWSGASPADSVDREIVGTGVQNGINYIDVKFSGTSGTSTTVFLVLFESNTQVAASNGQTWSSSVFVSVVGGNTNNITALNIRQTFRDGAGGSLQANDLSLLAATSSLNRFSVTATGANASIAFINSSIVANFADNSAIDITLRIGLPQLELGAFATSVIPTTTTALTRAADVASVNTLSPWYNAAAGTLFAQVSLLTVSNDANRWVAAISDGTTGNYIGLFRQTDQQPVGQVQTSAGTQAGLGAGAIWTTTASRKLALSYATNDFKFCTNGGAVFTDTAGTVPVVTQLQLGVVGSTGRVNGWLERLTYYPRISSNAELQALTV